MIIYLTLYNGQYVTQSQFLSRVKCVLVQSFPSKNSVYPTIQLGDRTDALA